MIVVERLCKRYGKVEAVFDLSFEVGRGEVVGVLGPNGAGKTTTLRILSGFVGMTSGRVRIDGHDVASDPIKARRALGYMPEGCPLYPEMRVSEYLAFRADLKGVKQRDRRSAAERAARMARADDMLDVPIGQLSKGYRQRVGLADALVGSPPLLILDEPTAGLDPNQIREVRRLLRELGQVHTILLSTHILSEVEAVCDRALVLHRGELVAQGSVNELTEQRRARAARLVVRDARARSAGICRDVAGVRDVVVRPGSGELSVLAIDFATDADPTTTLESVVAALVADGVLVSAVAKDKASLEDVFAALTENSDAARVEP